MAASVRNPIFARFFTLLARLGERSELALHRDEALAGLAGRVVEIGAGSGTNFSHYPAGVTEVVAVEPEPYLRSQAQRAAARAAFPVTVVDATADRLPLEDASVDAGVACLVLCSVPDQAAVLAELHRVIRPGGELRVLEHVSAENARKRAQQGRVDKLFWPRLFGGCHTCRDTPAAIAAAGFETSGLTRFEMPPRISPAAPHVIGTARRRP